ncbi:Uncharacterised protein [Pseudomonas aeruginosa]|nr:Uncharacterised protein [Pseudomonas aeruginosa]
MAEINPLSTDLQQQLADLQAQGLALLGVAADETPAQIVAAITDYVRDAREQGRSLDDEAVFALGALIGAQYVRGLGWHWGDVIWDGDPDSAAVGVLSPDESLFNNPIGWVSQIAEKRRRGAVHAQLQHDPGQPGAAVRARQRHRSLLSMQADRRDAPAHPARRGRQPERPASGAATRRAAPTGERGAGDRGGTDAASEKPRLRRFPGRQPGTTRLPSPYRAAIPRLSGLRVRDSAGLPGNTSEVFA